MCVYCSIWIAVTGQFLRGACLKAFAVILLGGGVTIAFANNRIEQPRERYPTAEFPGLRFLCGICVENCSPNIKHAFGVLDNTSWDWVWPSDLGCRLGVFVGTEVALRVERSDWQQKVGRGVYEHSLRELIQGGTDWRSVKYLNASPNSDCFGRSIALVDDANYLCKNEWGLFVPFPKDSDFPKRRNQRSIGGMAYLLLRTLLRLQFLYRIGDASIDLGGACGETASRISILLRSKVLKV